MVLVVRLGLIATLWAWLLLLAWLWHEQVPGAYVIAAVASGWLTVPVWRAVG